MFDGEYVEKRERTRKPNVGSHLIIIDSLEMLKTQNSGTIPKMTARIEESATDRVGAEVGEAWFINDGTEIQKKYTRGDLLSFGRCLAAALGKDSGDVDEVKKLQKALYYNEDYQKRQPARGIALRVHVTDVLDEDGEQRRDKKGNLILNTRYEAVEQTREDIKARRQKVEDWKSGRAVVAGPPAKSEPAAEKPAPKAETKPAPAAETESYLDDLGI